MTSIVKFNLICNRMVYKQMRNGKAIVVKILLQKTFFTFSGEPRKIFLARQKRFFENFLPRLFSVAKSSN